MSTKALQSVWEGLLACDLTTANKRWLAERLLQQVEEEESSEVMPYTMAEIDAMLDESEADFASDRVITMEEARQHRNAHLQKLLQS